MITKRDMIGQLNGCPLIMAYALLREQFIQGNPPNIRVFQNRIDAPYRHGGFARGESATSSAFWHHTFHTEQGPKPNTFFNNIEMLK
jgi:hypothetical protein